MGATLPKLSFPTLHTQKDNELLKMMQNFHENNKAATSHTCCAEMKKELQAYAKEFLEKEDRSTDLLRKEDPFE
jgi:hypothetical protein